jgi:hypothetical protein
MTLPSTGAIGFDNINVEIGTTSTTTLTLNDATVRSLTGATANNSQIDVNSTHGKTYTGNRTIKTVFITTTGSRSWTIPSDFFAFISVEGIGAGSHGTMWINGGSGQSQGGGGGAYANLLRLLD